MNGTLAIAKFQRHYLSLANQLFTKTLAKLYVVTLNRRNFATQLTTATAVYEHPFDLVARAASEFEQPTQQRSFQKFYFKRNA